jgi:hypothetical protein
VQLFLELFHLFKVPVALVLLLERHCLLFLGLGQIVDERVLFIVGDAELRANVDHELADRLTVIDQQGTRLAVQYFDVEPSVLVAVVDRVLFGFLDEIRVINYLEI